MQLINKKQGARLRLPARGRQNLPQLGHIGHDRINPHKAALRLPRNHLSEAGFAAARRSIKQQTAESITGD